MLSTMRRGQALSTMGQTLRLDANAIALSFADETMENLHTRFYRSKLTSDPPLPVNARVQFIQANQR